jgi:hypothetical protein
MCRALGRGRCRRRPRRRDRGRGSARRARTPQQVRTSARRGRDRADTASRRVPRLAVGRAGPASRHLGAAASSRRSRIGSGPDCSAAATARRRSISSVIPGPEARLRRAVHVDLRLCRGPRSTVFTWVPAQATGSGPGTTDLTCEYPGPRGPGVSSTSSRGAERARGAVVVASASGGRGRPVRRPTASASGRARLAWFPVLVLGASTGGRDLLFRSARSLPKPRDRVPTPFRAAAAG